MIFFVKPASTPRSGFSGDSLSRILIGTPFNSGISIKQSTAQNYPAGSIALLMYDTSGRSMSLS